MWNNLGEAFRCADDPQGARSAYQRAEELVTAELERTPDNVKLLIDLASFKVQLDDEAAAYDILRRVLELGVSDAPLMFDLTALYEELGERGDALIWLGRTLEAGYPLQVVEGYDGFAALREDPGYPVVVASTGVPEADEDGDSDDHGP